MEAFIRKKPNVKKIENELAYRKVKFERSPMQFFKACFLKIMQLEKLKRSVREYS